MFYLILIIAYAAYFFGSSYYPYYTYLIIMGIVSFGLVLVFIVGPITDALNKRNIISKRLNNGITTIYFLGFSAAALVTVILLSFVPWTK